jgi:hypothetical protein
MHQPLLIYGDYAADVTVALAGAVSGQVGEDVLQGDEDTYVSPISTALTLTIDLQSACLTGVLAIAGENLNGVLLQVHGSTDNLGSSDAQLSGTAPLAGFTAAWLAYQSASYRYLRLTFTDTTPDMRIYHVALGPLQLLPFMEDGADLDRFTSTTNHILGYQGQFFGSQKVKTERKLDLSWGQIMESEYPVFLAWAIACVQSPQAFFFVPDSSNSTCHFGYVDPGYTFSAPMKAGLRTLAKIPFTSRFA